METTFTFKLVEKDKIHTIIPLLQLLDPSIPTTLLHERLEEMLSNKYQCLGIYDEQKLIGICGIWTLYKYYIGKHIELDDVVIIPEYRNRQVGKKMMQWINVYAKEHKCNSIELNCYVQNAPGIKFWTNAGFNSVGYHFQKKLLNE